MKTRIHRAAMVAAVALLLSGWGASASAQTQVSNLTTSPQDVSHNHFHGPLAVQFTTGNSFYILQSVSANYHVLGFHTTIMGDLRADNSGNPGAVVDNLGFQFRSPGVYPQITFSSSGYVLYPNTSYWFVSTVSSSVMGLGTTSTAYSSPSGWTIAPNNAKTTNNNGATWSSLSWNLRFSVDATVVPEPSSLLGMAAGLTGLVGILRRRK